MPSISLRGWHDVRRIHHSLEAASSASAICTARRVPIRLRERDAVKAELLKMGQRRVSTKVDEPNGRRVGIMPALRVVES